MKKLVFATALGAMIVSAAAGAQAAPREISRQQAQEFAGAMFQRFDLNHDGVITRDEAEQARAQLTQGSEGKRSAKSEKMIDRLFGTSQSVSKAQFESMALARFDRQDANHDGVVTSAEKDQARASRQAPQ